LLASILSNCACAEMEGEGQRGLPRAIHTQSFPKVVIKALKRFIYTLIVAPFLGGSKVVSMITSRQIRGARALRGWSQQQLADKAIVSLNAVARLEKGIVDSRISTVQAIQKALVKAGIEFLDADQKGEGVRLKSPKS
jgi:DNA-binding XRE family transcriptional regulator